MKITVRELVKLASKSCTKQKIPSSPPALFVAPRAFSVLSSSLSDDFFADYNTQSATTSQFQHKFMPSSDVNVEIKEALKRAGCEFELQNLKRLYFKHVRAPLIARLLIHKHSFNDPATHWVKYQLHARLGYTPLFTSCLDVMEILLALPKEHRILYLDHLANQRVTVIEDWVSISTTQVMFYNLGPKDWDDISFYKGESDAAWCPLTCTATLSNIIWRNMEVVCARTYTDVEDCKTVEQSEAKAVLTILKRAKELGVESFELWTDNQEIHTVLNGEKHVQPNDVNWQLYMAVRAMRSSFTRLNAVWVPRELLHTADSMLRTGKKYPTVLSQSTSPWEHYLKGFPVFKMTMSKKAENQMKNFGKPLIPHPKKLIYYVELDSDRKKLQCLSTLIKVLSPETVQIAVKNIEKKPEGLVMDIKKLLGHTVTQEDDQWTLFSSEPCGTCNYDLLVSFDGPVLSNILTTQHLTILLCSQNEKENLDDNISELSVTSFIFFHGACMPTPGKKAKKVK